MKRVGVYWHLYSWSSLSPPQLRPTVLDLPVPRLEAMRSERDESIFKLKARYAKLCSAGGWRSEEDLRALLLGAFCLVKNEHIGGRDTLLVIICDKFGSVFVKRGAMD